MNLERTTVVDFVLQVNQLFLDHGPCQNLLPGSFRTLLHHYQHTVVKVNAVESLYAVSTLNEPFEVFRGFLGLLEQPQSTKLNVSQVNWSLIQQRKQKIRFHHTELY